MGRKNKKYEPEKWETQSTSEHFTRIYDSFIDSDAYRDLTHSARTLYILLKRQYKGGYTGNTIICPYSYLKEYGMNSTTVKRAQKELESHGFIKVSAGIFVTKNLHREPNEYTFISEWKKWKKVDDKGKRELPEKLKECNNK